MTTEHDLPPTQYLILEVLAARYRLDEEVWTFPSRLTRALHALQEAGLISVIHGVTENTVRAQLTDAGRDAALIAEYARVARPDSIEKAARFLLGILGYEPDDHPELVIDACVAARDDIVKWRGNWSTPPAAFGPLIRDGWPSSADAQLKFVPLGTYE